MFNGVANWNDPPPPTTRPLIFTITISSNLLLLLGGDVEVSYTGAELRIDTSITNDDDFAISVSISKR